MTKGDSEINDDSDDEALSLSIARLERCAGDIPPGWRWLYAKCIASLKSVSCSKRCSTSIHIPDTSLGLLTIYIDRVEGVDDTDVVLKGILRKARHRACHTCEICGHITAGKSDVAWRTLCSRCEVRQVMHDDLVRLLRTLRANPRSLSAGPILSMAQLSKATRQLIPGSLIRQMDTDDKSHKAEYLLLSELKELQPEFEKVKAVLSQLLEIRT